MIFIDRKKVAVPKVLSDALGKGQKETALAIAHFTTPGNEDSFDFKIYRDDEVKGALKKLFLGKCAYCESLFLHVYSGDVEHFRPKGEITEATPKKPGYYWLAADWNNLLLSCRNCNQKLRHELHGKSGKYSMGKMNQFPLIGNDTHRVKSHTNVSGITPEEEYRLLLDPCVDDPEEHFEYDEIHAVIKPKRIKGQISEKAKASIEVYVLQRVPLVQAREKVLIEILAQIQRVKEAVHNLSVHSTSDLTVQFYFEKIMRRELMRLKQFLLPSEPYLGMAKQIINKFLHLNFTIEIK